MTKEPNKDFRQAVREVIHTYGLWGTSVPGERISEGEAADRIILLCKEMLVPEENGQIGWGDNQLGWNACRAELLKQLWEGERCQ